MRNVYLIGMPSSGKSALGKRVAQILGWEYCDTDQVAVEMSGEPDVSSIFANKGMKCFRKLESEALKQVSEREHVIVATGGGIVLDDENIKLMMNSGRTVFLDVSVPTLKQRMDISDRPLLDNIDEALENMYYNRIDVYRRGANVTLENEGDLEENAQELAAFIGGK